MFRRGLLLSLLLLLGVFTVSGKDAPKADALVNLNHLEFLTEPVQWNGQDVALVHIYSEAPDYQWVDAAGEGISALDDVARAAVVYLWQYERTGDKTLLDMAHKCLNFALYMQADDGEFYNFVLNREGKINETGGTSYKSLGWWAMRGLWALGEGIRVFDKVDKGYADTLATAYLKTEQALAATLGSYGQMTTLHGFDIPAWIPGGEPAVASIGLLGLSAYYQARPNEKTAEVITRIADGVSKYRLGSHSEYPFGMHPVSANAPGFWHDWGAHMTHALVVAGMALNRKDWIDSAAADADSFLLRQLTLERYRNIGVVPDRLGQIAYGTNMLVQTYAALYHATGEVRYARYAGLAGSWYFGNNMAGVQMYDPATGRVFDGINGPVDFRVNRNAGAESTIEGLMSLIALADIPDAVNLLDAKPLDGNSYRVYEAEDGQRVLGTPVYYAVNWTGEGYVSGGRFVGIGEGQRLRLKIDVPQEDDYLLYVAHMHQSANSSTNVIQRISQPPKIDGNPDDWPKDIPALESNTARQFLRGAGFWKGPDVDSHALKLAWDADNLYIQAVVRDPEHQQPFTLSNVWQGDTLWFYMTRSPDAKSLSAKFTLAQTPDGPQVWDWVNSRFLKGATLAWKPMDGGYIYEAAVPWKSLDIDTPSAGMQIGLEAGRGVGGNSFMDLTGRDPDVPTNLLRLVLVEPGMQADEGTTPKVSLAVRLDEGDDVLIPESISPDTDYFWLDRVTKTPVHLTAGEHTLRYSYAGEGGSSSNPGLAKVDAFYLQPAVARKTFQTPDGGTFTLSYNTLTGVADWQEAK
jgi:hypothetical protein